MRIVGGTWRGRMIDAPEDDATRPTTDRNREALTSMVLSACNLDLSDKRVLDAFAGSGAVGLELLSRGAEHTTFIESSRKAVSLLKSNITKLGAEDLCTVLTGDSYKRAKAGAVPGGPFGIVFLDPPYAHSARDISQLIEDLANNELLAPDALIVYERDAKGENLSLQGATMVSEKTHGTTSFVLYRRGDTHV